jgi:hypothetical protein
MSIKKPSQLKGASWHNVSKKWRSRITINGKRIILGYYDTEKKASKAYYKAYIELVLQVRLERKKKKNIKTIEWQKNNPEKVRKYARKTLQNLRKEMIKNYGSKCVCCGESREEFMSIDHINGYGNQHKKLLKKPGNNFYRWLKQNNWPKDEFRLLCYNCNCSRGFLGYCPHEKENQLYGE